MQPYSWGYNTIRWNLAIAQLAQGGLKILTDISE